jgi:hypothetical protein
VIPGWSFIVIASSDSDEAIQITQAVIARSVSRILIVMAGLVPAIHVFIWRLYRRDRPKPDYRRQLAEPSTHGANA